MEDFLRMAHCNKHNPDSQILFHVTPINLHHFYINLLLYMYIYLLHKIRLQQIIQSLNTFLYHFHNITFHFHLVFPKENYLETFYFILYSLLLLLHAFFLNHNILHGYIPHIPFYQIHVLLHL